MGHISQDLTSKIMRHVTEIQRLKRISLIQVQKGIPIKLLPGVLSPCQVRFASRLQRSLSPSPSPFLHQHKCQRALLAYPCTSFSLLCQYALLHPCSCTAASTLFSLVLPGLASVPVQKKKKKEMQNVNPGNKEFADYTVS